MNITLIDNYHLKFNTTDESSTAVIAARLDLAYLVPGVIQNGILTLPYQLPFGIRFRKYIEQYYSESLDNISPEFGIYDLEIGFRHPVLDQSISIIKIFRNNTYRELYQMDSSDTLQMLLAHQRMTFKMKIELQAANRNMKYKIQKRQRDKQNCLILDDLLCKDLISEVQKYL